MRWVVGSKSGEGVWMTLDADDEEGARAEWKRVLEWPEDDALELTVTRFVDEAGYAQWMSSAPEIAWYKENITMDEALAHIAPKRK